MQQPFGFRFGRPDLTSVVVVAKSLVAGDVIFDIEGHGIETVTLNPIGIDAPLGHPFFGLQAGFVGSLSIINLQPYRKYKYTASQNGSVISVDENGESFYFWTGPEIEDDYILIPITCDNSVPTGSDPAGGYTQVRAIASANPDKAVYFLHIDDHYGYMNFCALDDTGGTDHKITTGVMAQNGATMYDYSLGAFSSFGLYSTLGNYYCTWGQNEDRIWCMRNIPVLPGIGNNDAGHVDMGMLLSTVDDTGDAPTPKTQFDNSQVVWNEFLAPFQGNNIYAGTQAWSHTLGCVKIVTPDGITEASGDAELVEIWDKAIQIHHPDQITTVVNEMDDDTVPFKLLSLSAIGIRYLANPPTYMESGSQYPYAGNTALGLGTEIEAHPEYKQLMTNAGGLMSKPSCNGKEGVMLTVHGNHHLAKVMRNANTDGVFDEWFYSISVGTINGSANRRQGLLENGDIIDGSEIKMIDGELLGGAHDWWVVPFFVYGSRKIKEVEMYFYDRNNNLLWSGKVTERSMNDVVPLDFNVSGEYSVRNIILT